MPVQQIMVAQRIAAGSGGLPPTTYAGLTFWYDGVNSVHYLGDLSTSGLATANGDSVGRMESVAAINRVIAGSGGGVVANRYISGGQPSGMKYVNTLVTNAVYWPKPAAGVAPSSGTAQALSNLVAAGSAVCIALVRVNSVPTIPTNAYDAWQIFGDYDRYLALQVYGDSGAARAHSLNYDGNYDYATASATFALSTWVVLTLIHRSGRLITRVNGAELANVASGNTSVLTQQPTGVIAWAAGTANIDLAQQCTYNAARTDAEVLEVERYFGAMAGLSF